MIHMDNVTKEQPKLDKWTKADTHVKPASTTDSRAQKKFELEKESNNSYPSNVNKITDEIVRYFVQTFLVKLYHIQRFIKITNIMTCLMPSINLQIDRLKDT